MSANAAPPHTLLAWVYGTDRTARTWLGSRPNAHTVMLALWEATASGHTWWRLLAETYGTDAVERVEQRRGLQDEHVERAVAILRDERAPTLRAEE